ncbi:hypothetical protein NQ315_009138 [Exocentrus adspersus]|uniref:Uncharacterized protein n=1 Tax=Exocentrus adspersus TaxID=1586481 RepID=A0AAV8WG23_9CUCU|nr:hypothetical protein NQ315_009138 [Exocentrus adspersus]
MADWRINEKYRKPRRAKGTPFFVQRNYYALGVLVFGAFSWYLYELSPASQKLKRLQLQEDKLKIPEGLAIKIKHHQAGLGGGPIEELLAKAREKEVQKLDNESEPPSWFILMKTFQNISPQVIPIIKKILPKLYILNS